ncbi:ATP-binding protein [Actinomadura sp. 9N407]|uniref:ATP-binding protein n=1 Tax=Actinomadura sp. 9N407 TaxID=3375154 RepID=UPI0037AB3737
MTTELTLLSRVAFRGEEIAGPRLRALIALMAWDLRAGSSGARLIDGLWPDERPDERPANPSKALQVLVSRARAQLGPGVIASTSTGYRLSLGEEQVDASAVLLNASASARHARDGDHKAALAQAEAGLALWEGAPERDESAALSGPPDPLAALRLERASTYHSLVRSRALAQARLGRHEEAAGPLADLVREHPRDEELLLALLRCEAATAGASTALGRYDAYRRALRDEFGTDPGAALQAVHQELLRQETPPVRSGVPHEPNPLLGRDGDLAAVLELLRTSRVTSIVGPGGLGKTRLATAVSRAAEQRVVHLVALAGVERDEDVATEVASALGAGDSPRATAGRPVRPGDLPASIAAELGPGPALLVLDNCEHVVRGAAELVGALVAMARDVRVLTTSRAPLELSSESVYPLPELDPRTAAELFAQRARAARPGVDLPADAVEELCRHLDGLPLAVELAAARVRAMSVAEIARALDDRFALLRGGARDVPERHRTLHAVVDWSWNLLDPGERAALRALSIFPGGFTADAARHLLPGDALAGDDVPQGDGVRETLERLAGQSLLGVTDTETGTRFRMLETVREFCAAHREAASETGRVTAGFLAWARDFGETRHDPLAGPAPAPAVERIRAEQDNLVQALRLGLAREDGAAVSAVATVLGSLWTIESNYSRVATLCADISGLLTRFRPGPEAAEITRAALTLCTLSTFLAEGPRGVRTLVALRRLPDVPPDTLLQALGTVLCASPEIHGPDHPVLRGMCESEKPMLAGVANAVASHLWENEGEPDAALRAAERMLSAFERARSPLMEVMTRSRLSELCLQVERGDAAERHVQAALPLLPELGDLTDVASIRWAMALAALQQGRLDESAHWLEQAEVTGPGETYGAATFTLGVRAEIALAGGDAEGGLRLWRTTAGLSWDAESLTARTSGSAQDPWTLEVLAVTVIAHAYEGRLGLVRDILAELPGELAAMLGSPLLFAPTPAFTGFTVCGTLLLALGLADLGAGDTAGHRRGARMVALAERFRFSHSMQPTMSAERARRAAEEADGPAYADAVSSYAGLSRRELRDAALEALRAREPSTSRGLHP